MLLAALFVFLELKPGLIFSNPTPTGGDLGAQVWAAAQLRDFLLPNLSGWSPEWFAGYPTVFYAGPGRANRSHQVVLLYNMAFKLVVALGPALTPVAVCGSPGWAGSLGQLPR